MVSIDSLQVPFCCDTVDDDGVVAIDEDDVDEDRSLLLSLNASSLRSSSIFTTSNGVYPSLARILDNATHKTFLKYSSS